MAGKNCWGSDSRRPYPRQVDANAFRKQSKMKSSAESIFSCVSNVSDTGTYEIEICERQSRDSSSLSRRAICSKSPAYSDCSDVPKCLSNSKSLCSVSACKSDNNIVDPRKSLTRSKNRLIQSYYPCFCIATLELSDTPKPKIDLVNKETNTKTTDQVSKSLSSSTIISSKKDNELSSTADSDKTCVESHCTSSNSSDSSSSDSSSSNSTLASLNSENSSEHTKPSSRKTSQSSVASKTNTAKSVDTDKSCDCATCRYCPRESSDTYTVLSEDKKGKESQLEKRTENGFQMIKTTQALELISEEKEKQWAEGVGEFRSCKCEISRYEERLKNLENLHLPGKTAEDENKNKESCECTTTLTQFAEIKGRIEALEKLCMDTLGIKAGASEDKGEVNLPLKPVTEDDLCTEERKSKCDMKSLPETLDEASRTAIELAKIKKRLINLEVKMLQEKPYNSTSLQSIKNNTSFGKDKKVAVNITTTYITPTNNKLSDKEIQVIDFNGDHNRAVRTREDLGFVTENKLAAYWMMKKMNPWGRIVLRDEAVQTPSRKQMDRSSTDSEPYIRPKRKRKRMKKSCHRIHLCKECDYYISQKIGRPRGEGFEKLGNNRKLDENLLEKDKKFGLENINRLKKSFNSHQLNKSDFLTGNDSKNFSLIEETTQLLNQKPRKERKKFKLCQKYSKTNLKESVPANYETDTNHEPRYAWASQSKRFDKNCDSATNQNTYLKKEPEKCYYNIRMPHQSFQIYQTHEMSRSLLLHSRSSRAKTLSSRHGRRLKYHEDRDLPEICPFWASPRSQMRVLYNCHDRPFSCATGYESWEKKTSLTVTASALKDPMSSCSGSVKKKKNRLNPFQYLRGGRKIKIPVLFEEICHSSENKLLEHQSSMSMRVVQVGICEEGKNILNPFKKLVRKFSHSQSLAYTEKFIPFGISKCCCDNTVKADKAAVERQKNTNSFSLVRRN